MLAVSATDPTNTRNVQHRSMARRLFLPRRVRRQTVRRFVGVAADERTERRDLEGNGTAARRPRLQVSRQIRESSDSAARNIAEGFGRFSPPQFAHFLDISRGSAQETRALLRKGLTVGYWPLNEYERLDALAIRGIQAVARLQRYLRSPQARRNAARRYR